MPIVTLELNGGSEAPEGGGATTMTLRRSYSSEEIEVNLSISGTANNQSDYVSSANQVRMPAGSRSVNIEVQAIDDTVRETQEDIVIKVLPGDGYSVGSQIQARAIIPENDEKNLPEVEFTLTSSEELESDGYAMVHVSVIQHYIHISDSTLYNSNPKNFSVILIQDSLPVIGLDLSGGAEAAEGGGSVTMTLTRNDRGGDEINVNLSISGTANNQSDYVSIANQVRMPAGSRSVNIEVQAIDDTVRETQEDIVIKVLPGDGYSVGSQIQARAIIPENDEKNLPEVEFTLTSSGKFFSSFSGIIALACICDPTLYPSPGKTLITMSSCVSLTVSSIAWTSILTERLPAGMRT
jgi:hypothetical protein